MEIDVIIPVYKPGEELFELLRMLKIQSVKPSHIIIMNTEKEYWDAFMQGENLKQEFPNLSVEHLPAKDFDHGGTRRKAVNRSKAQVFVMMTQDAIPADDKLLEELVGQLNADVAVAYARQLATEKSGILEKITREFNYPEEPLVKSVADKERLGIKTYFCSDVCAAYRREIYDKLGGFVDRAIFNEDMIYAAGAIEQGYKVAYAAGAKVYHAHNYTIMQQFHRNFDLGVSQAMHPEVFSGLSSESEGLKLVKEAVRYLKEHHMLWKLPYFFMQCAGKYMGYLLGKHYKNIPGGMILRMTSNKAFWSRES